MASGRFNLADLTEREKEMLSLALEIQERLNKTTAIALHYHPCPDPHKSPNDHLDEVYSFLKSQKLICDETYYNLF